MSRERRRPTTRRATSNRVVLPRAASYTNRRRSTNAAAAVDFINERKLNEAHDADAADRDHHRGWALQHVNRGLELLGCSDAFGNTKMPPYVTNVTYPVVDDES